MTSTLYATMACPFAHRAMLALALRPSSTIKLVSDVPTANQLGYIDHLGHEKGDILGTLAGQTAEQLQARKALYKSTVICSGETPTLQLASGEVISESEIVCEYIDAVSPSSDHRLVPTDPVLSSRMRLSMKRFNPVIPTMVALLKNQEVSRDDEIATELDKHLSAFVETLEVGGRFCHSSVPTLADCHCGPFIFRFGAVLRHYRNYDVLAKFPRVSALLNALQELPEWKQVLSPANRDYASITEEKLCSFYEQYANNMLWGKRDDGSAILVGRGKRLKVA